MSDSSKRNEVAILLDAAAMMHTAGQFMERPSDAVLKMVARVTALHMPAQVPPQVEQAIGELSAAMGSPAVQGRVGDPYTPVIQLAAQRLREMQAEAEASALEVKRLLKTLDDAVARRVVRKDGSCTVELDFRCEGMAKMAESQLKFLATRS